MKRSIGIFLALALLSGAGLAQGGRSGGAHGGGSHAGGHPGTGGQRFTTGPTHFTTGPMHFTTGPTHFTGGHVVVRPGIRPAPVVIARPAFPHHRVIVGGAIVVGTPFFWYPPYPYPYYYPYPYVAPAYGGSAYTEAPTYVEQGDIAWYCPDYQDYYPNVPSCPSPWMQVIPGAPPQ